MKPAEFVDCAPHALRELRQPLTTHASTTSPEGRLDGLPLRVSFLLSSLAQYPAKQGREELLTAAVERGPSEGARSGSKESSSCPAPHLPRPRVARAQETL